MKFSIMSRDSLRLVDLNRRKAIRERCLNCSCWIPSEVTKCIFTDCPLFPFRTGKGKQDPKARVKAIRKYCLWCMAGQSSEVAKCVSRDCPLFAFRMSDIDRSVEIASVPEKDHIGTIFETNIGKAYKRVRRG
jgi:hypothetical protein